MSTESADSGNPSAAGPERSGLTPDVLRLVEVLARIERRRRARLHERRIQEAA